MNFIMFLDVPFEDMLFGCLVTDDGLSAIRKLSTLKDKISLAHNIEKEILNNIIASTVLKRCKNPCNNSFELINWAASKPGAGTILLMYLLNQGVTIVADRKSVSPLARKAIMKMANSSVGKMLSLKPLDNYLNPVTNSPTDDCRTYTNTGGFSKSIEGTWQSKIETLDSSTLDVDDYMDFSVSMNNPKYIPVSKITQDTINNLSSDSYNALSLAIRRHFGGELAASTTNRGRYGNQPEAEVRSVDVPSDVLANLPPEIVITENKLKVMIIESLERFLSKAR